MGSRDPGHAPFKKFVRVMSGLSLETCVSNVKFVALTISELLAFNAQKFRGWHDTCHAPFENFLRGHFQTVPGNMHVKFEVCGFALTTLNGSDWPVRCRQIHRQTHIEWKQYLRHSHCSVGGDNKVKSEVLYRKWSTVYYTVLHFLLYYLRQLNNVNRRDFQKFPKTYN